MNTQMITLVAAVLAFAASIIATAVAAYNGRSESSLVKDGGNDKPKATRASSRRSRAWFTTTKST